MAALAERWNWPPSELDNLTIDELLWWGEQAKRQAKLAAEEIKRGR